MKITKYTKYIAAGTLLLFLWQCEPAIDEFSPSAGDIDLTSFVAIGDSYSAGYTDGALGYSGQMSSFPNIMAQQFKVVGMTSDFKQPLTPEGTSVGTTELAPGVLNGYYYLSTSSGTLAPTTGPGDSDLLLEPSNWINSSAPFNNVAVPGAKSFHLIAPGYGNFNNGTGNYNPFYTRFASNPLTSSILNDAMLVNPTFFSLWIGGNDVLLYALEGGEAGSITDIGTFTYSINTVVNTLVSDGAKGVIANIPDINTLPYFNTVPYNLLTLDAASATALNGAYAQYNAQIADPAGLPLIYFEEGNNAPVVEDPDLTMLPAQYRFRQIKIDEKILLNIPQDSIKNSGWGSSKPIPASYVLDETEISDISNAIDGYNNVIESISSDKGLAIVDINGFMNKLKNGMMIDGNVYTTEFISGNVLSLDGIHATSRGYAIIANEFIKSINKEYNTSIPLVNINDYATVKFP